MLGRPRSAACLLHSRRPWRRQPGWAGGSCLTSLLHAGPRLRPLSSSRLTRYKRPRQLPSQAFSRAPGPAAPADSPYPSSSTRLQALHTGLAFLRLPPPPPPLLPLDDALRRGRENRRGEGCSASPAQIPHPSGGRLRPYTTLLLHLLQSHPLHPQPAESQQTARPRPLPFSLPPRSVHPVSMLPSRLNASPKISLRKAAECLEELQLSPSLSQDLKVPPRKINYRQPRAIS